MQERKDELQTHNETFIQSLVGGPDFDDSASRASKTPKRDGYKGY